MNAMTRIGGFGLALAVLFGVSYVVGTTIGPSGDTGGQPGAGGQGISASAGGSGEGGADGAGRAGATGPGGLAISAGGYTLEPGSLAWGALSGTYTFRVLGPDGRPVTSYTRVHDADLHLVVVRRDLSGYQHLHPTRDAAGTWSVPLRLAAPGVYRVFADFVPATSGATAGPAGAGGATSGAEPAYAAQPAAATTATPVTLGADLTVAGDLRPVALPAPSPSAKVAGGYTVNLRGDADLGEPSDLAFSVARNGRTVDSLEPYLGALGHLVAIRQGDLAYLHVHPGAAENAATGDGSGLSFATRFPSVGTYRLYLDFKHGGQVHTAEFTVAVTEHEATPTPTPQAGTPGMTTPPAHVH